MRIRPATDADAALAAALWTEGYTRPHASEGRTRPYAESDYFEAAARGEPLIAEDGGERLGIVVFSPPGGAGRAVAGADEAELSRLVVTAAARRRGIGRELALEVERRARECGAEGIALWSRPYQVQAHRLYESLGYRRAPERDGSDSDGARVVLVHRLDGSR